MPTARSLAAALNAAPNRPPVRPAVRAGLAAEGTPTSDPSPAEGSGSPRALPRRRRRAERRTLDGRVLEGRLLDEDVDRRPELADRGEDLVDLVVVEVLHGRRVDVVR